MAFKLGSQRNLIADQGKIEKKLSFKNHDSSIPGTPVLKKNLKGGILGEANNDGTIFISHKVKPESEQEQHVIMHEMVHMTDMKLGKLGYNDYCVKWNGNVYERKDGMIKYEDQWLPEGSKEFPWEKMPWE